MEILSKEMIKPSSATPQHLHQHKLSFLDQIAPPTYVHLVFFYEAPTTKPSIPCFDPSQISQNLKQSLSQVLTRFYPLAGRIIIDQGIKPYVDCNDDGVEYVETRVHARLLDVVTEDPNPGELRRYVPNDNTGSGGQIIPLSIQVNLFDCGGVAVGVCISHKIADMESLVMFVTDWSAICRRPMQQQQLVVPSISLSTTAEPEPGFDILSSHFPAQSVLTVPSPPDHEPSGAEVVTKRFVFDKEMLSELKRIGSSSKVTNPTRIEAVTAFLWGSFISAHKSSTNDFTAIHSVNVRSKLTTSSSHVVARSFGNGSTQAIARLKFPNGDEDMNRFEELYLHDIIPVLTAEWRRAIRTTDVRKLNSTVDINFNGGSVCIFSSWCRFPVYEVDYGWGKPRWVSTIGVDFKNLAVFMDTKTVDGIEAWVTMAEREMALIEANYKRLCIHMQRDS